MHRHDAVLKSIFDTVRTLHQHKQAFRIFHGSSNSTRPAHHGKVVDISALRHVIKIDAAARTAIVEPNVPMDKLVAATLQHGLFPPVVMEFPGITVGGGYAGSAGESSSFKHGYFSETVNWVELVLANGQVVRASSIENADLFQGAAGAAGTLGITTLLELQLIPAKRYVKTTYKPTRTIRQAVQEIQEEVTDHKSEHDYVDGLIFSRESGAIITGVMTDEKPPSVLEQTFTGPWDPWFYIHVQNRLKAGRGQPLVDYIPLTDYLFRYDRGGFWVGLEAFRYFPLVPFNTLTRWCLNDFMHTRMLYRALHGSNRSFGFMVQDLSLPYSTAEDFMDYTATKYDIWPLWLCPLSPIQPPTFHPWTASPGQDASPKPMLNIGLWGRASDDLDTFVQQNRDLEQRLGELGGRKVLYSHTYYTEQEFWSLYDRGWYEDLRRKYQPTTLPTIFDKVKVDAKAPRASQTYAQWLWSRWPLAGIAGILSAIQSRDYLLHRAPMWQSIWSYIARGKSK